MRSSGFPVGFSFGASATGGATGERFDPFMAFNFAIEIEGLLVAGFRDASGLGSSLETDSWQEGGINDYVHHFPRRATAENLVLRRGITGNASLWNWYYNVTQGIVDRKNGTIMLLDAQLTPLLWWNFRNAYPVRWSGPHLDATAGEVAFEEVELVHEGLTLPLLGQGLALTRQTASLIARNV